MGDNFAPLVSQLLLDFFLAPEYIDRPRMALTGFQPMTGTIPHGRLIRNLMTEGTVDQLNGTCFTRIVWGHGAHVLYYDTLVTLRRLVADFAHMYVLQGFKLPVPMQFESPRLMAGTHAIVTRSPVSSGPADSTPFSGLKVVLYTRGTSGRGRSIAGEQLIVDRLTALGARVAVCCDYNSASLEQQLALAAHADVVRRLIPEFTDI